MEETDSSPNIVADSASGDSSNAIGRHWSQRRTQTDSAGRVLKTRWWQHAAILRHINRTVCGNPVDGFSAGLSLKARALLKGRLPLTRGISVGCGNGGKEMALLKENLVQSFDLYELAETRIADGREMARRRQLAHAAHFFQGDAFELANRPEQYDLVHWNNSLHHMLDVEAALDWSWRVLKPGGLFYMDDFVGPDRFQWTPRMILAATAVRQSLADRFLINPFKPDAMLPRIVKKPDPAKLKQSDPSEAADSSRILECMCRRFPGVSIVLTGGVIYHLALSDLLANFTDDNDVPLLERLLHLDDLCTALGDTHYAVALALKT